MTDEFIFDLPEHEYLTDRSRTSGSCLSMVARDPREYGRHLAGKREDKPTDAMRLGKYVHAVLLEGRDVVPKRFAFAPSRADYLVPKMVEVTGPRGGKRMVPDPSGTMVPQDDSEEGRRKLMLLTTEGARAYYRRFAQDNAGRTVIHPEQQPLANAMIRAVERHPEAAALLAGPDFAPEVVAHWTDENTGELMRARFDGLRRRRRLIVELKTVAELDPTDNGIVTGWVRSGWARKAALYLDAAHACTGHNHALAWILVEATEDEPRVAVLHTACDDALVELGRLGSSDWGIPGYLELIERARWHREHRDFRAPWERESMQFRLPPSLDRSLAFEHEEKAPPIKGAQRVEVAHG